MLICSSPCDTVASIRLPLPTASLGLSGAYWYIPANLRPPLPGWRYEGPAPVGDGWLIFRAGDGRWVIQCLMHWAKEDPLAGVDFKRGDYNNFKELIADSGPKNFAEIRPILVALVEAGYFTTADIAFADKTFSTKES